MLSGKVQTHHSAWSWPLQCWPQLNMQHQLPQEQSCIQGLQAFYCKIRRAGCSTLTGLPVGLRLLESLIALSEARARADLRQVWLTILLVNAVISAYMCSHTAKREQLSDCYKCIQHPSAFILGRALQPTL